MASLSSPTKERVKGPSGRRPPRKKGSQSEVKVKVHKNNDKETSGLHEKDENLENNENVVPVINNFEENESPSTIEMEENGEFEPSLYQAQRKQFWKRDFSFCILL